MGTKNKDLADLDLFRYERVIKKQTEECVLIMSVAVLTMAMKETVLVVAE